MTKKEKQTQKQLVAVAPLSMISNVAGTRDFLPSEMAFREFIRGHWTAISLRYGYQEYDTPLVEHAELYTRKAGGDEILRDMYSFQSGGQLLALRPEMTPSVCRLVLEHLPSAVLPLKWFSRPQCWRNETVTTGRRKEFYQWNVDCFGLSGVGIEAECLAMVRDFCLAVGLTAAEVEIRVSDRRFLGTYLARAGLGNTPEQETAAFNIIDRLEKDGWEICLRRLAALGATVEGLTTLEEVIGPVKDSPTATSITSATPNVPPELQELFALFPAYELVEWVTFDPSIVRGLAYYTGFVFEVMPRPGISTVRRALCGGGRYDHLLASFDPRHDLPAVGFGLGDVVVMELLTQRGKRPALGIEKAAEYCVVAFPDMMPLAITVARNLRARGERVLLYHETTKRLNKAFAYADRQGARWVVLLAPEEAAQGLLTIKDLRNDGSDPLRPKQYQQPLTTFGEIPNPSPSPNPIHPIAPLTPYHPSEKGGGCGGARSAFVIRSITEP